MSKSIELLIAALLGALVQFFVPVNYWGTEFYKKRMRRKDLDAIARALRHSDSSFVVGDYEVPEMSVLPLLHGLHRDDMTCRFVPDAKRLPETVEALKHTYLPEYEEEQRARNRTIDYNDTYGLRGIRVRRPQSEADLWRDRRNTIECLFEPSNFKFNLIANEALDKKLIVDQGKAVTVREHLGLAGFDWASLPEIPIHMWFSTVTGVRTSDDKFVVAIRSGLQLIGAESGLSDSVRASMSAAEGMLRPVDSLTLLPQELPSPFKTSERSIQKELGLVPGEHYMSSDLELIGMCFDTQRYQPLGVFYIALPVPFSVVLEAWKVADDHHENSALLPIGVGANEFADLLQGKVRRNDLRVELFSNHQRVGVLLTACRVFGFRLMRDILKHRRVWTG